MPVSSSSRRKNYYTSQPTELLDIPSCLFLPAVKTGVGGNRLCGDVGQRSLPFLKQTQWGRDGHSAINNVKQLLSNCWHRTVNVTAIFGSQEVTSSISESCASAKSCKGAHGRRLQHTSAGSARSRSVRRSSQSPPPATGCPATQRPRPSVFFGEIVLA